MKNKSIYRRKENVKENDASQKKKASCGEYGELGGENREFVFDSAA